MSSERYNISLTALFIGVPVLVGASCYYFYFSKNRNPSDGSSSKEQQANKKPSPHEQLMQLKRSGNQNFSWKNYKQAIDYYSQAIELSQTFNDQYVVNPEDLAIFYQNRAACKEAINDYESVIADCTKAVELKKTYIKAYLRRAKAHEKLEQYDKALVDAFSANLLEKFQNQTSMILTENIVKASSKAKAIEAMKTHKLSWPANQTIKSYFSAFVQDPFKDLLKGETIKSSVQLQPFFEEANKLEKDNDPLSLLIRGSCLSLMGDMKAAEASFDKILSFSDTECSPKLKANALIKKSAIVISEPSSGASTIEKDLEHVHELLEQAIQLDPENPDTLLHKAQALTLSEKLEDAVKTLEEALELKQDFHAAKAQKFYIEFKLMARDNPSSRKLQELLDTFKTAVKENPDAQDLLQMYAQVLTEMSYFEQADQVLLNISKLDPSDGSIYVSRALLQFHLKSDPDAVATLIQEALRTDPKIIFAYEILGSIETQRGKIDDAIKIFETALKYAQSESEYARCFSLLDSAKCQKAATELLDIEL